MIASKNIFVSFIWRYVVYMHKMVYRVILTLQKKKKRYCYSEVVGVPLKIWSPRYISSRREIFTCPCSACIYAYIQTCTYSHTRTSHAHTQESLCTNTRSTHAQHVNITHWQQLTVTPTMEQKRLRKLSFITIMKDVNKTAIFRFGNWPISLHN